jgi:hypothetical protein
MAYRTEKRDGVVIEYDSHNRPDMIYPDLEFRPKPNRHNLLVVGLTCFIIASMLSSWNSWVRHNRILTNQDILLYKLRVIQKNVYEVEDYARIAARDHQELADTTGLEATLGYKMGIYPSSFGPCIGPYPSCVAYTGFENQELERTDKDE